MPSAVHELQADPAKTKNVLHFFNTKQTVFGHIFGRGTSAGTRDKINEGEESPMSRTHTGLCVCVVCTGCVC